MRKLFKFKNLAVVIALLGLVLLPALGAFSTPVRAQTSPRGSDLPPGRVLQAADNCPAVQSSFSSGVITSVHNGLTVQAPATVSAGANLQINYSVKQECVTRLSGSGNYSIGLYHQSFSVNNTNQNQFADINNKPQNGSLSVLASTNTFTVGPHRVVVVLSSDDVAGNVYFLIGSFDFTLQAAQQTGSASLSNNFLTSGGVNTDTVFYEYSLSYNQGASGINATSVAVNVDCGGGTLSVSNPLAYGTGKNARCQFPKPPNGQTKDYTIKFQALEKKSDGTTQPIPGAYSEAKITVTGKEANTQGTSTGGTGGKGLFGDLAFGGFELFIGWLLKLFSGALKYTILWIVAPFIEAILSIHTYEDRFAQVIYSAWEIFRNLGNIFFILSIVAIGVATVFRISGWAVKDLLVKLIVGAILINFSLSIAQSILGIADTVQNQFLPNDVGAIREIANHLFTADIFKDTPGNLGGFNGILEQIMNFFLTFASFIAFLGIAALLAIRVLFLWILLMLSPLPYIAMVLPISRSMSKKWWSEFGKWAFMTPVIAFMLNLTALITVQTKQANILSSLANTDPTRTDGVVSGVMFAFASNAIPLGFLYMTLKAASVFGTGSANFIGKAADKGVRAAFWPAAAAGAALGAGATKVGVGAAAAAKNVGMLPFTAGRLKLAKRADDRQNRLRNNEGSITDKVFQGASNVLSLGKYAQAKRDRLQEARKGFAKKREEQIKETEQRVLSWDGLKVAGNRARLIGRGGLSGLENKITEAQKYQKLLTNDQIKDLHDQKIAIQREKDALTADTDYAKASKASVEAVMEGLKAQIDEKTELQKQAIASTNEHFDDQLKDIAADKSSASDRVKDLDAKIAAKQSDLGVAEAAQSTHLKDIDTQIAAKRQQIEALQAAEKDPNNTSVVLPGAEVMSQWQTELSALEKEKEKVVADKTPILAVQGDLSKLETEKAAALANQARFEQEEEDVKEQKAEELKNVEDSFDTEIGVLAKGKNHLDRALKDANGKEPINLAGVAIADLGPVAQTELSNAFAAAKQEEIAARDALISDPDSGINKKLADNVDAMKSLKISEKVTSADIQKQKDAYDGLQAQFSRSQLKESYLATRERHQSTKAADARAPFEGYDYESRLRAFKEAEARGDKYLALNLAQEIQKEGDWKDMLRRFGYSQTLGDSQRFIREKFGKLGFSDKQILDIMKESDDRIKSSSPDLGGMVKVDETTGKRELADEKKVMGKLFDGAMAKGDGTLASMWSKMGAPNVLTWDAKTNGYVVSDYFKEGLSRLDPEDEVAMRDFYRRLSAGGARQMSTDKGWLKDQPGAIQAIEKEIKALVSAKYTDAKQGEEKSDLVVDMIRAKSGQNRGASVRVNDYFSKKDSRRSNRDREDEDLDAAL